MNNSAEIFAALRQLEKERGIPVSYMTDRITQALLAAYKKDRDGYTDNVFVELNEKSMRMYAQKEVVDEVFSPATEIQLAGASPPRPPSRSSSRVSGKPSGTWSSTASPPRNTRSSPAPCFGSSP